MTITTAKPQWIAEVYPVKPGRDHLGIGSVSANQILTKLSPGVQVLTFHPRYHSFYTFLLDEFVRRRPTFSRQAFTAFYRPREFIFSLGAYLCEQPEHGDMRNIVGGQKTGGWAAQHLATYNTAEYSSSYIKSPLGGYGLYYRTVLAQLGLIYPGGQGLPYPFDVPSEKGQEIAEAFRSAVEDTTYYREFFDDDAAEVPLEVIQEYIHCACLCQLQVPDAPDRVPLLDVFLHGGNEQDAASRRATFRLLLDIADKTQGFAIDEDEYRQLIYFGASDTGTQYTPRADLQSTCRQWRLYQAREYYAFALNTMWFHLCVWGMNNRGDMCPIPLSRFAEYVERNLDFDSLAQRLNLRSPNLQDMSDLRSLLQWLRHAARTGQPSLDTPYDVGAPLHEHTLYHLAQSDEAPDVMIAGMVAMLAMMLVRFDDPDIREQPEWAISKMGADGRLSVHGFIQAVQRKLQGGPYTIAEFAHWLYADYVILQHQLVATSKLPDNTFRFRRDGDRLRFVAVYDARAFWNSRFPALSTTLNELGLCGEFESPSHPLTADGRALLEQGDLK